MNTIPDKPSENLFKIYVPLIITILIIPVAIIVGLTETQKRTATEPYFAPSSTPEPTILRGPTVSTPTPLPPYTSIVSGISRDEMISIFRESILTKEQNKYVLYRWETPVKVWLRGQPTSSDRSCANLAVGELTQRMTSTSVTISENQGNFVIYLLPKAQLSSIKPDVNPTSIVELFPEYDLSAQTFTSAKLLISSDLSQEGRCLELRKYLLSGLGVHPVTKNFSSTNYLSLNSPSSAIPYGPVDREIIRILYSEYITPGLTGTEITRRLSGQQ